MEVYELLPTGEVLQMDVSPISIQTYIDSLKNDLSEDYYKLEKKCMEEAEYGIAYKSFFNRSSIDLLVDEIEYDVIGEIPNYQYYEPVFFNQDFQILNSVRARINRDWKFRYIINDCKERLPVCIIKKLRKNVPIFKR